MTNNPVKCAQIQMGLLNNATIQQTVKELQQQKLVHVMLFVERIFIIHAL